MRLSNKRGFTLVELMVALAIASIISAAMYSAYVSQQRINQAQDQIVEMQQNLRAGLDMMVRELRMAGYNPDDTGAVGFTVASATTVQFTLISNDDGVDNDVDGTTDEDDELKTVQFSNQLADGVDNNSDGVIDEPGEDNPYDGYGDGTTDLGRLVGSNTASRRVLVENVENIEFYYTLLDGSQTLVPTSDDLTNNNIRSIQISILARASSISLNYVNDQVYTTGSGATWGPFGDNIRRRMQVMTVHCRNMGW